MDKEYIEKKIKNELVNKDFELWDKESINLSLLLIDDTNLLIILNDPDVYRPIKELIIKMQTDYLFISKLSNTIQKDDFQKNGMKSFLKNKKNLYSQFQVMIDITTTRQKDAKRFVEYFKYIKKFFKTKA